MAPRGLIAPGQLFARLQALAHRAADMNKDLNGLLEEHLGRQYAERCGDPLGQWLDEAYGAFEAVENATKRLPDVLLDTPRPPRPPHVGLRSKIIVFADRAGAIRERKAAASRG